MKSLHFKTSQRNVINENFYFYESHTNLKPKKEAAVSSCPFFGWVYVLFQMLLSYNSFLLGQEHCAAQNEDQT